MRTRVLLAGAVLSLVTVVNPVRAMATEAPSTEAVAEAETDPAATEAASTEAAATENSTEAAAGGEAREISHDAEECIELLESGKDVDACQEAPKPIIPEKNEIIWGGISFLILAFALIKFLLPAMKKAMDARTTRIKGDLDAAESAKSEAQKVMADYQSQLADAKNESNRIIEDARQQAEAMRKDLIARAEADAQAIRARATEDLDAQASRIKADLETHVKSLSLELAGKVVGANLNNDTNQALVDRYIADLGRN